MSGSEQDVVIVSAVRTPIGSFCGSLSSLKSSDLGSIVVKESLKRANLEPTDVSEVILGQVYASLEGQNPARQAAIKGGIPNSVPAYTINMLCGSGMKAIANAYLSIKNDENSVVVAGGQESMSRAPHAMHIREGLKMGNGTLIDTLIYDGLTDAFNNIHMGITAENIAKEYSVQRDEQDKYACSSQTKAEAAIGAGHFDKEIVAVTITDRKGSTVIDKDEFPKPGTTPESLAKLRAVFVKDNGTVTAGNASGINDGAAALVVTSSNYATSKNIKPLAKIIAYAQSGVDPKVMGIGPVPAVELVLKKAQWSKDEVDLYELNEAFAAQAIACVKCLGLNPDKVNVNGGAIALGHPIGASGARIVVTLLHSLERTGGKKGIASLCIGGGMGIAIAVERL